MAAFGLLDHSMQTSKFDRFLLSFGTATLISATAWAQEPTNRFGFTGPEIFPIDNQISLMRSADLNGDGLNDLIVVNNSRSKINLLYNQTGSTNKVKGGGGD